MGRESLASSRAAGKARFPKAYQRYGEGSAGSQR